MATSVVSQRAYADDKVRYELGTRRVCGPKSTLARIVPHFPKFGITRLSNISGLDTLGVPVFQCIRPGSLSLSVSQGKGVTPDAAKVSAAMEAIESWHAENIALPSINRSLDDMRRMQDILALERLRGYMRRPLDRKKPISWIEARDLVSGGCVWLPRSIVDLDRTKQDHEGLLFRKSSLGLASGNVMTEAILHALCELIERDCLARWLVDSSDPFGIHRIVDLETVDDVHCRRIIARLAANQVTFAVIDLTSELDIPCYQCIIVERTTTGRPLADAWGLGCHPEPAVALSRALTEAAQSRLTYIAGARDDLSPEDYDLPELLTRGRDISDAIAGSKARLPFRKRSVRAATSVTEDLRGILGRLVENRLERVLVVELTRPNIGIPVCKAFVEGLIAPGDEIFSTKCGVS